MLIFKCITTLLIAFCCSSAGLSQDSLPVRVFILAGQSNMQGQGVVDLDHEEYYNGGRGILKNVIKAPENLIRMGHLQNRKGEWVTRNDVWIRYQTETQLKTGRLTIGFTGYDGNHHIGPELQFGHILGAHYDEPVLLIKTAWGGKSLYKDFRPPSSGGEVGPYYTRMMEEVQAALKNVAQDFPVLKNRKLEVTGFVWQQGWNDMGDQDARAEYEQNLVNLINDVRAELNKPNLPVVVGELGNGGETASDAMKEIRAAEKAATLRPEFKGTVQFVPTAQYARPAEQSPNVGHGHHWFGNAESYFLIGDGLGRAMVSLLSAEKPRVLILGDSISIGYTPQVRKMLADQAVVIRPMVNLSGPENCAGTDRGIQNIDRWVKLDGGNWDVVHFNFGLHDMKHVQPDDANKNSNDPNHPEQSPPEEYEKQLKQIVARLKQTNARLVFATTTPVPEGGVQPFRDPAMIVKYNEIASQIMKQNGIEINDLYSFAKPRLAEIQQPVNVHFNSEGSKLLGQEVVRAIRKLLNDQN